MSVSAMFATSAAASVSPPSEEISDALNIVTFCIYSFAEIPTVLYASSAYVITLLYAPLKIVSMPPVNCS